MCLKHKILLKNFEAQNKSKVYTKLTQNNSILNSCIAIKFRVGQVYFRGMYFSLSCLIKEAKHVLKQKCLWHWIKPKTKDILNYCMASFRCLSCTKIDFDVLDWISLKFVQHGQSFYLNVKSWLVLCAIVARLCLQVDVGMKLKMIFICLIKLMIVLRKIKSCNVKPVC